MTTLRMLALRLFPLVYALAAGCLSFAPLPPLCAPTCATAARPCACAPDTYAWTQDAMDSLRR